VHEHNEVRRLARSRSRRSDGHTFGHSTRNPARCRPSPRTDACEGNRGDPAVTPRLVGARDDSHLFQFVERGVFH